jgi:glutamate-5-semialdehyde dehydrogenase
MTEGISTYCRDIAQRARRAAWSMSKTPAPVFDQAILAAAGRMESAADSLRKANAADLQVSRQSGLPPAFIDRLTLTDSRLAGIVSSLKEVAGLPCPLGEILSGSVRPNGLMLSKVRVPIGVVMIIYEARPNVTTEAASLCLKSGNAAILRGGSEAFHTNVALWRIFQEGLQEAGLPADAVQIVQTTDRQAVGLLLSEGKNIDLVIPRGGRDLIERVVREASMPVIKHYEGICHVYVHSAADLNMAEQICINSKVQRPGVCNSMETLLVDQSIADVFMPRIASAMTNAKVQLRGCPRSCALVPDMTEAIDEDWTTEYLDLILSIRVVDGLAQAVEHINTFGSHHTDAIVTRELKAAEEFVRGIDSACVFVNCSTRFSDGGQFGMGAEIGISTDKVHARGPMGLEELTTYKWVAYGNGQVRT